MIARLSFLLLFLGLCSAWEVGFSAQSISPPNTDTKVCLGGFGACLCRQATGVHDNIFARAAYLAIGNGNDGNEDNVLVISMDLVGVSNKFIAEVVAGIERAAPGAVDAHRIVISSTHSHSTPDLAGLWGGVATDYRQFLVNQTVTAGVTAITTRQRAKLFASSTTFTAVGNRRGWERTDQEVLVLWATTDDSASEVITVLVNFAAHPVVVGSENTLISRDWVNGLIDELELTVGVNKAIYLNGAQGDASPNTGATGGGADVWERAYNYGAALANVVVAAMATPTQVQADLYFDRQGFSQCITNQKFLAAAGVGCMDFEFYAGTGCPRTGVIASKKIDTQVSYLRLGQQVQIAILPGEALTRMAVDGVGAPGFEPSTGSIKGAMFAQFKGIFGLSSDFLGYFVPQDEWNSPQENKNPSNKDYEEGVSLGGNDANVWIRDRVKQLIVDDPQQGEHSSVFSWFW